MSLRWMRKVGEPSELAPVGFLAPWVGSGSVPDGWELLPAGAGPSVSGKVAPNVEHERAWVIFERFMAGESVADLAAAFAVPVATIEDAIRWFGFPEG